MGEIILFLFFFFVVVFFGLSSFISVLVVVLWSLSSGILDFGSVKKLFIIVPAKKILLCYILNSRVG